MNFFEKIIKKYDLKKNSNKNSIHSIRQLYALPTRFGIYLGFALVGGFVLSARLENNFLLLIILFQMIIFFLSILWSADNMLNISIKTDNDFIYIPTFHKSVPLKLSAPSIKYRVLLPEHDIQFANTVVKYPFFGIHRGLRKMDAIQVKSLFPFSIVSCWVWLNPGKIIVTPKPVIINSYEELYMYLTKYKQAQLGNDNFDYYRKSIDQDHMKKIDWKKYLAKNVKLTKISNQHKKNDQIYIDGDLLTKNDKENGLSIICGVLIFSDKHKLDWQLKLNKHFYTSKGGDYNQALRYLAMV